MDEKGNNDLRLTRLINRYQTELLRVSFYFLKDRMLSEDAVQDTFLKVYKNIDLCPEPAHEKAWVYKIALNTIRDALRRLSVRKRFFARPDESLFICSVQPSAETIFLHTEIMLLPKKMKEIILLYYYEDFTVSEIASILNLSQSSVSGRLKRARDRLYNRMKGE